MSELGPEGFPPQPPQDDDSQDYVTATEIATLFLDQELRIKSYTPGAAELFDLMDLDAERILSHLRKILQDMGLEADAQRVLNTRLPITRDVQKETDEGADHWFRVTVRSLRTQNDRIDGVVITFVDISANKEIEASLRESEERYRLLIENLDEYAIFMMDPERRISTWNAGAQRLFGYTEAEAIGQSGDMIFTEEDRAAGAPENEMTIAMREGEASDDRWHMRADGSLFWATGIMTALYHPDGSPRGFAKILRDNTERKQAEEQLRAINEALDERVQERTEQVRGLVTQLTLSEQTERHRISQLLHDDLQQRLYSLQFHTASLRTTVEREEQALALKVIEEIEEALETAIQITRTLSVDLSPPILRNEGLAEALSWLASQMKQQHGLAVRMQTEGKVPVPGAALRILLFQIVRELLFNVVKHAGVAEAEVRLARTDHRIRIEVVDRGKGYDAAAVMADTTHSHGLLRCKYRLELVGGQMEIESIPGDGTRIVIDCPMDSESG